MYSNFYIAVHYNIHTLKIPNFKNLLALYSLRFYAIREYVVLKIAIVKNFEWISLFVRI